MNIVNEKVKLWTFQHYDFYKDVMEHEIACCTKKSFMWDDCSEAFEWMAQKMHERVGNPEMSEASMPVWAWHTCYGKFNRKPRRSINNFDSDNLELVFMELEIPRDRILVSDFLLWHLPMNGLAIGNDEGVPCKSTWDRIFDPTFNDKDWVNDDWEDRCLQATFWCLHKEDIVYADLLQRQDGSRKLKVKRLYDRK